MNLVLQGQYTNACQQACCAMLANVSIEEIIALVGPERMGKTEHDKVFEKYGVSRADTCTNVEGIGLNSLVGLRKRNSTLMLSVYDTMDANYAHAVLLHEGNLYDPYLGINPHWPWSRVIALAFHVREAEVYL